MLVNKFSGENPQGFTDLSKCILRARSIALFLEAIYLHPGLADLWNRENKIRQWQRDQTETEHIPKHQDYGDCLLVRSMSTPLHRAHKKQTQNVPPPGKRPLRNTCKQAFTTKIEKYSPKDSAWVRLFHVPRIIHDCSEFKYNEITCVNISYFSSRARTFWTFRRTLQFSVMNAEMLHVFVFIQGMKYLQHRQQMAMMLWRT